MLLRAQLFSYINGYERIRGLGDTVIPADGLCFTDENNPGFANGLVYEAAIFDINTDDIADYIIIFNSTGGINPDSSLAIIESIYPITTEDGYDTLLVNYYMDGELKTATVSENVRDMDELCDTKTGDLYKFNIHNSLIRDYIKYGEFERYSSGFEAGETGGLIFSGINISNYNEYFLYGPITDIVNASSRIEIAEADNSGKYDIYSLARVKLSTDSNIYIIDPDENNDKFRVGTVEDAFDIWVDKILIEHPYANTFITSRQGDIMVKAGEQALGMLDYAIAYEYDGEIKDFIIYKAHNFGRYYIEEN